MHKYDVLSTSVVTYTWELHITQSVCTRYETHTYITQCLINPLSPKYKYLF